MKINDTTTFTTSKKHYTLYERETINKGMARYDEMSKDQSRQDVHPAAGYIVMIVIFAIGLVGVFAVASMFIR